MKGRTSLTLAVVGLVCTLAGCNTSDIWQASQEGRVENAKLAVKWHRDHLDQLDADKQWTPLQHAIANSYGDVAAVLLEQGADPHVTSGDGRDAWDFAADVPNARMRQFILATLDQAEARRQAEAPAETVADAHQE